MNTFRACRLAVPALILACLPVWAGSQAPTIRNFHQVNEHIYRGGQPEGRHWQDLAAMGVKTVLDLRRPGEHSTDEEARAVKAAGMEYVNLPMEGIVAPKEEHVAKALELLNSDAPVFVHCKEGKDRTGTVIALYRISHDGWDNHKAQKEANSYGMHWFERGMKRYIRDYRPAAPLAEAERN
jgi:protein tyrosine/serine phosphatase